MRFKMSSVFDNIAQLLKNYNEQQSAQNNIYRLLEVRQTLSGNHKLTVQVVGKSSIFECSPQAIVADDKLIEGFSKKDIRIITYLACHSVKKPKYKIIMQEFCDKFNRMIFKLRETENESLLLKTAGQIVTDKNLINSMSKEDVSSISYIAGYECSQGEK